jgi:hypothetical protein
MGNFIAGVVVAAEPNWAALDSLPAAIGLTGYRHRRNPYCLLDFWCHSTQPSHPFADGYENSAFYEIQANIQIERFETLAALHREIYGAGWIRLALQISRMLEGSAFLFAGDDEFYDFACKATPTAIERLRITVDTNYLIELDGSEFKVSQQFEPDEPRNTWRSEVVTQMAQLKFVQFEQARPSSSDHMYGNAFALWPSFAGAPEDTLELLDLNRDLQVAFERRATPIEFDRVTLQPERFLLSGGRRIRFFDRLLRVLAWRTRTRPPRPERYLLSGGCTRPLNWLQRLFGRRRRK